jgi:hypothetical protein
MRRKLKVASFSSVGDGKVLAVRGGRLNLFQQCGSRSMRIQRLGEGEVSSARGPQDIFGRTKIDASLVGVVDCGKLLPIRRGLHDKLRVNPAIVRRWMWKIVPEGGWAAKPRGILSQVTSKIIRQTDGPSTEVASGHRGIYFKHATRVDSVGMAQVCARRRSTEMNYLKRCVNRSDRHFISLADMRKSGTMVSRHFAPTEKHFFPTDQLRREHDSTLDV